jgi:DNA segregation ATPase FtsK/SpoIIIE, S-DNA-T family
VWAVTDCLETHVLVAGATGAGKGSVLWSLIPALAPLVSD